MNALQTIPKETRRAIALLLLLFATFNLVFSGLANVDEDVAIYRMFMPEAVVELIEDMKVSNAEIVRYQKAMGETGSGVRHQILNICFVISAILTAVGVLTEMKPFLVPYPILLMVLVVADFRMLASINNEFGFALISMTGGFLVMIVLAVVSSVFSFSVLADLEEGAGGFDKEKIVNLMQSAKVKAGQAASTASAVAKGATSGAAEAAKNATKDTTSSASGESCQHCGKELKSDAVFCSGCGKATK